MTAYLYLFPAFLLCCVGSVISYSERTKAASGTPFILACLAACCGLLWGHAIKSCSPAQVMALSVAYDGLVFLAYYALPLVFMGVRPEWNVWAGLGLVVAGMILVKWE